MIDERDALQEDQEALIQYNFISLPLSFFFKNFILVITCACIFFFVNRQIRTLHVILSLGSPTSWLSLLTQANSEHWNFFFCKLCWGWGGEYRNY